MRKPETVVLHCRDSGLPETPPGSRHWTLVDFIATKSARSPEAVTVLQTARRKCPRRGLGRGRFVDRFASYSWVRT
jgi:hypothetical protein